MDGRGQTDKLDRHIGDPVISGRWVFLSQLARIISAFRYSVVNKFNNDQKARKYSTCFTMLDRRSHS
jgi:hypothetical protein